MPINNFKPFSFAVGARVLSQVSWENDAGILQGFTAGILTKERLNKALRQPSAITAALAEVVGTRIGEDMLDNGDFSRLVRQIDAAFGSAGGTGGGGTAQSLQLKTTGIAFVFENSTSNVSTSPTITFTVEMVGFTGTVVYTAQARDAAGAVLGTFALGGVPPAATMTAAQFLTYPTTQYVVVTASVTLGTGVVLTETETIFKSVNGDGALQIRLTNQAATLPALADGTVISYATAYGTLEAYKGQTRLTNATDPSVSFSLVGYSGFSTIYPAAQAGISVNATTGAYVVSGGMVSDAALIQIRCTFSSGGYQDEFFTLSKSRQGQPGAAGTAPRVDLDATNQIFVTPSNSTTPAPSSVNITALVSNIPSPTYQWRIDGVVQANVSPVLTLAAFAAGGAQKVVRVDVVGSDSSTAFDTLSFFSIKDGDDAIRAGLDNETRTISCLADGTPTAGLPILSQIVVVRGATVIDNTDGVTYQLVSSSGFTGLSLSSSGAIEITGISTDVAEANYTITVNGTVFPAGKLIAVKSRDGSIGADAIVDRLTNDSCSVPADSSGNISSYAAAVGVFQVSKGALTLTNVTSPSVAFSVVGYTGFGTTYPAAQAGISINAVTGEYAVTAGVTGDIATVTLRATVTGGIVRDRVFSVAKQKAGAGSFVMSFEPRVEALLPTNSSGDVVSYVDANTTIKIRNGATDDTANWTPSLTLTNVAAAISGSAGSPLLSVSQFIELGEIGTPVSQSISLTGTNWTRINKIIRGTNEWIMLGYNSSADTTKIKRSTDYVNWVDVTVIPGRWFEGAFQGGAYVLIEFGIGSTNRTLRSTDGGLNWSNAVNLPASGQWLAIRSNATKIIVTDLGSTTACYSTNGGASWSTYTYSTSGLDLWPGAGDVWLGRNSSDVTYKSLDNGATFTVLNGLVGPMHGAVALGARTIFTLRYSITAAVYVSDDAGASFYQVTLPLSYQNQVPIVIKNALMMFSYSGPVMSSADGTRWRKSSTNGPTGAPVYSITSQDLGFLPFYDVGSNLTGTVPLLGTSADTASILVTATKSGQPTLTKIFPVRKIASAINDLYVASAFPAPLSFPATLDGVVSSYLNNTITASIQKNGANDTGNWAITWTTLSAGLTPSSGSGNVATFTAMANNVDSVVVRFVATKAGLPAVVGDVLVQKNKGSTLSGPQRSVYSAFTSTATSITLRFKPDGYFQIKQGAGSFIDGGVWHNPPSAGIGNGFYLRVDPTGHAITGDTTGAWNQLNVNRDFTLTDTNPGTHITTLAVAIGTSNVGANAVPADGSLKIIV